MKSLVENYLDKLTGDNNMRFIFKVFSVWSIFLISGCVMAEKNDIQFKFLNYRMVLCSEKKTGIGVIFATEDKKSSRDFSFSQLKDKKMLIVSFSGGKGNLSWDKVKKVTYHQLNEEEGYVTIEFDKAYNFISWKKYKEIEFGVMSLNCWLSLDEVIGSEITMEVRR